MPPLGVEVRLVGQAALHDVGAVVGAGSGRGHAAAVGTVGHLHDGPHAVRAQPHLQEIPLLSQSERTTERESCWKMKRHQKEFV